MVDQRIINFLTRLNVNAEAAQIYLCLLSKSALSAQAIAQATKVPKTTVYRRIDELKSFNLIEERVEENTRLFATAPAHLLELLVAERERQATALRAQLPDITNLLHNQQERSDPETKVLYYRGRSGIQQMVWNNLRTKKDMVGYTYRNLNPFVGDKFVNSWSDAFTQRKLSGRDIYSDEYIRSKFSAPNPEAIAGWGQWEPRYVPPEVLNVQHQMDIHDDVVAIYNWVGDDVFGVEIYNAKVAALQRQLFELLWEKAVHYSLDDQRKRYQDLLAGHTT